MQRDYILRMLEQFIQAIGSIILARKGGHYEEALDKIQHVSLKFLGSDLSAFLKMTPDQLVQHFSQQESEKGIFCAGLLNELASICEAEKRNEEALQLKLMALSLYVSTKDMQFKTALYREKVSTLIQEVGPLPPSIKAKVEEY